MLGLLVVFLGLSIGWKIRYFFPFYITHILSDNGLEFTDKFVGKEKVVSGNHIFDKLCKEENIDHRLTAPFTPKTNGMVERANGTIKDGTIKVEEYQNINELISSLRKELGSKVRTPFDALECWFKLEPKLFKISPSVFQAIAFQKLEQRGET